jgi:hypothetical protein
MPKNQRPVQKKKSKDEREWTTPTQKAYLVSKQSEYYSARETKTVAWWLSVELRNYFEKFPTEPVTPMEMLRYPDWSIAEKRKFEETVSDLKNNINFEQRLPFVVWAESKDVVQEPHSPYNAIG